MIGYVERITPNYDNAQSIVRLRSNGLIDAGLPPKEAKKHADPSNINHIEAQVEQLEMFPSRYLGMVALRSHELIGYIRHDEWQYKDEMPYFNPVEKMAYQALINFGKEQAANKPFGLTELYVAGFEDERVSRADGLLMKAIELAEPREMMIGHCMDTDITVALYKNNFEPTGRFADVNGVTKQLLYRPAFKRDKQYSSLDELLSDKIALGHKA